MTNQLKNLFNSPVTETTFFLVSCSMIGWTLPARMGYSDSGVAVAAALAGGVILVAWLVWSVSVLATKKTLKPMSRTPQLMIETCSYALLLFWMWLIQFNAVALIPFGLLFIWNEYRLYRCMKNQE